jgi:hypothetical protein
MIMAQGWEFLKGQRQVADRVNPGGSGVVESFGEFSIRTTRKDEGVRPTI